MIPSLHASFLSRKQILESGTRFRLNRECWISHFESGWHDGLVVLLLLGKLAGVRMPVWKEDSLTAVASPLKWGRAMGVLKWGRECSAVRRPMQRTALAIAACCDDTCSALHLVEGAACRLPPLRLLLFRRAAPSGGSHCSICVSGQLMRKTFSVARVRAV